MEIRSFAHKSIKKLYEEGDARGLPREFADKLRKMLAYLDEMEDAAELQALPSWKARLLPGDRRDTWSLSLTRNRRLIFRIDLAEGEICDVNLEESH